jgi:hypothetical protein
MAGLVPAIYVLLSAFWRKDVDARHEAGHGGRPRLRASSQARTTVTFDGFQKFIQL